MKILIIDIAEEGLDLAIRYLWAGHDVKFFSPPSANHNVGRGIVQRVSDWRAHMQWADLIVPTAIGKYADDLEWYFQAGYPIFGSNKAAAAWELDREEGMRMMDKVGIATLPFNTFTSIDDAIKHVLDSGDDVRFVSKPCGEGNNDRSMTYVSKSHSDMIYMLEKWKGMGKLKSSFLLQEFAAGIEFAVGGWFGPAGFHGMWEENFEHKKLMNDEKGPNTGEMGTAMKYCDDSNLADATIKKLEESLHALNFVGNIDLSVLINKDGIWPMEFTMRMGWPAAMIQLNLHKGDPAQWMLDMINGKNTLQVRTDVAIGVVVAIPDFPYVKAPVESVEGTPIYGINPDNINNIHFCEIMAGTAPIVEGGVIRQEELFVSAGVNLLTVVGTGPTVKKAADRAYKIIGDLEIPNSPLYRTDIGKRLEKQIPELQALGFAENWSYE